MVMSAFSKDDCRAPKLIWETASASMSISISRPCPTAIQQTASWSGPSSSSRTGHRPKRRSTGIRFPNFLIELDQRASRTGQNTFMWHSGPGQPPPSFDLCDSGNQHALCSRQRIPNGSCLIYFPLPSYCAGLGTTHVIAIGFLLPPAFNFGSLFPSLFFFTPFFVGVLSSLRIGVSLDPPGFRLVQPFGRTSLVCVWPSPRSAPRAILTNPPLHQFRAASGAAPVRFRIAGEAPLPLAPTATIRPFPRRQYHLIARRL